MLIKTGRDQRLPRRQRLAAGSGEYGGTGDGSGKKKDGRSRLDVLHTAELPEIHEKQYLMDTFFLKKLQKENNCTVRWILSSGRCG